jgi:hypothetical protein
VGRIPVNGDPRRFPVTVAYIAVDEHCFFDHGHADSQGA